MKLTEAFIYICSLTHSYPSSTREKLLDDSARRVISLLTFALQQANRPTVRLSFAFSFSLSLARSLAPLFPRHLLRRSRRVKVTQFYSLFFPSLWWTFTCDIQYWRFCLQHIPRCWRRSHQSVDWIMDRSKDGSCVTYPSRISVLSAMCLSTNITHRHWIEWYF